MHQNPQEIFLHPHRNPEVVQGVVSRVSNPSLPPAGCSSHVLRNFLQEQQKIVSGFRAQPWPMQMKIAAVKSATHSTVFTAKVFGGVCSGAFWAKMLTIASTVCSNQDIS